MTEAPLTAALRDAVAERWLAETSAPLEQVAAEEGPAPERLRRWLDLLAPPSSAVPARIQSSSQPTCRSRQMRGM